MNRYEKHVAARPKPPISIDTVQVGQVLTQEEALILAEQLVFNPFWHSRPWPAYVARYSGPFRVIRAYPASGNAIELLEISQ